MNCDQTSQNASKNPSQKIFSLYLSRTEIVIFPVNIFNDFPGEQM